VVWLALLTVSVGVAACRSTAAQTSTSRRPLEARAPVAELFVSPEGNDAARGTKDEPFATLERARDAARVLKASGPVTVWLRRGTFRLEKPFSLSAVDSNTTYSAFAGEAVSVTGGVSLSVSAFDVVTDPVVFRRIGPAARAHVLVADLKRLGVPNLDRPWPSKFRGYAGWPELFFAGQRMQLARWPNEGFATMAKVVDKGSVPRTGERPDRGGTFQYVGDRPERWQTADEVYLDGYWAFRWFDEVIKVSKIDPLAKHIVLSAPAVYGLGGPSGGEFRALNLLEELDSPGEYQLDRERGLLYFWPPSDLKNADIALSVMEDPMVIMTDCENVTLRAVTLEVSRGPAVRIAGGENNLVDSCTIRDLANDAVRLVGGKNNGVARCELHDLGGGGISLSGGDRKTLTPSGNFAEDNHIHDFGRLYRAHHDAIQLDGCGGRASHNVIHDAPDHAIDFGGNDNVIEFNEVYRVCMESDDAGAIYTGRNWAAQGNVIRYNFIHDLGAGRSEGNQAVYLDDCAAGTAVYGNVIRGARRGILIGGGRDNTIENNVIVDCPISVHIDSRGIGHAKSHDETWNTLTRDFETLPINEEPWRSRYPHLVTYLTDDAGYPKDNVVARNLIVRAGRMNLAREAKDLSTFIDNFTANDEDALAFERIPGFKPIPFDKVGLRSRPRAISVLNTGSIGD
jgi:parallel beta-helix repeat protein